MRKAFTLLEVLISVSIFAVIMVFIYKTLDDTKYSNKLFAQKQEQAKSKNRLYNILLEDIAEAKTIKISQSKDLKSNLNLVSFNSYHNAYFTNIAYLVSSNDKLVRIESKDEFKYSNTSFDFYENNNAYIDILLDDIEVFEIIKKSEKQYIIAIKQKNKPRVLFNTFKLFNTNSTSEKTQEKPKT